MATASQSTVEGTIRVSSATVWAVAPVIVASYETYIVGPRNLDVLFFPILLT